MYQLNYHDATPTQLNSTRRYGRSVIFLKLCLCLTSALSFYLVLV